MGETAVGVCVLAWLATLSVYDVRDRRLPNWLTIPGAIAVLGAATIDGRGGPAAVGAVALFAVYLVVHLTAPAAMGAGDVKLAIGLGALTGAFGVDVWTLAAITAPLLTAIAALLRRMEATVPHGFSMCLATTAAVALAIV
jgi:leader peptidase (prepilin peptidase)/N-methyltransferase